MGNNQNKDLPAVEGKHKRTGSCPQLSDLRPPLQRRKTQVPNSEEEDVPASRTPHSAILSPLIGLESDPSVRNILFSCPVCSRQCFDGNMPKNVVCACGETLLRTDEGLILQVKDHPSGSDFDTAFNQCTTQFSGVLKDLETVSFGWFGELGREEDLQQKLTKEMMNLRDFFMLRRRLISEGECFQHFGAKFKVLSAFPSQGFVAKSTVLSCSDLLTTHRVATLHITPLAPHVITNDLHQAIVQPYFLACQRHTHLGQYLNMKGLECIVTRMSPDNGLIDATTAITFDTQPLHKIKTMRLMPYLEDLPIELQQLDRVSNMHVVLETYILPYFKGWRRVVTHGQTLTIQGVQFRINSTQPVRGVVTESTSIIYHGKAASRRLEQERQIQQDEALARSLQDNLEPNIARIHRLSRSPETRDMLLQLIEMLHVISASGGPEGASQQQIDLLPTHKVTPSQLKEQNKCLICLSDFEDEESVRTLPCCKTYI